MTAPASLPPENPEVNDRDDGPARCYAVIPAAGSGRRAGLGYPKQYHRIAGSTVLEHSVQALCRVSALQGIAVVLAPDDETVVRVTDPRVRWWRLGGETRAESVLNGLVEWRRHGARAHDWVLVHDAARCLVDPLDVEALISACANDPVGGLLALPLADTLKAATAQGRVAQTLPRDALWLAQTPQMFRFGALQQALEAARSAGFAGITDEASAIERTGAQPRLVRGQVRNIKLTYPEDFAMAESLLAAPAGGAWRIGEGWDVHALVPGRALRLGGVEIPFAKGLLGHSDADALLHAITDALLGAAGLGDIGSWFPDTDERFRGADSASLLQQARRAVQARGWMPVNVDATVVAQAPRLAPYRSAMQASIARCLGLPQEAVNVKAKTAERLGPVGQGLAIEARAVVLLQAVGPSRVETDR
jgi:2-C-methyl-D-erythritol 4-phosphate cytidylyltransferase/2-C-methyl-D-erythritol 2,4-cyclodiphosphate synthase